MMRRVPRGGFIETAELFRLWRVLRQDWRHRFDFRQQLVSQRLIGLHATLLSSRSRIRNYLAGYAAPIKRSSLRERLYQEKHLGSVSDVDFGRSTVHHTIEGPRQAVDHGYHAKEHCPPLCRSNASNSKPWSVISPSTGTDPRFRRVNIDNNGTASWAGGSYDSPGSSLISRIR